MAKKKRRRSSALPAVICALLCVALAVLGVILVRRAAASRAEFERETLAGADELSGLSVNGVSIPPEETVCRVEYNGRERTVENKVSSPGAAVASESSRLEVIFSQPPAQASAEITGPDGLSAFSGDAEKLAEFRAGENGEYGCELTAEFERDGITAQCVYRFTVKFDVQPRLSLSSDTVPQGGALLLTAENLRDPETLSVEVEYPYEPQVLRTESGGLAYIPINYMRDPGEYKVAVSFDGETRELAFTVTETEYEVQHLTVASSTVASTVGSSTASDEINEKFYPLFDHFDDKVYWSERFMQPVEGSITTEYGIKRYTNNAATPSRHAGIDIAAAEGTPIAASNSGVVLFADYLQMTGYTVLIEHGMGVHTLYYHMSGLNCSKDDFVNIGDTIGYVGSTGFATGPHLHFAVMVGDVSVSPWYVFDGSSDIYKISAAVTLGGAGE